MIRIELGSDLVGLASDELRDRVAALVADLHAQLGIAQPAPVAVEVVSSDRIAAAGAAIEVAGERARIPYGFAIDRGATPRQAANAIGLALYADRERFVTDAVVAPIAQQLGSADRAAALVRHLVRCGRRMASDAIALAAQTPERATWSFAASRIALRFAPPVPHVAAFGGGEPAALDEILGLARAHLHDDLGLPTPTIELGEDSELLPDELQVQLNDLRFPPEPGVADGELWCIARAQDELRTLPSPVNGVAGSVVRRERALPADKVYDRGGYAVLALTRAVRRESAAMLTGELVTTHLDRLARRAPSAVKLVRELVGEERVVRVFRTLLEERVPIRDALPIHEAMLAHAGTVDAAIGIRLPIHAEPGAKLVVLRPPDRDLDLAEAVRERIRGNLCGVFARDRVLFVALLDPAWEARFGEQRPLGAEERQRLAAEVARATGWRAGQMTGPALLTSSNVRRVLRDALALEFPWLGVLAFSELDPMFELMPIAVVEWGLRPASAPR